MGIVRAYQKGTLKGKATPEVQGAASSMKKSDVKKLKNKKVRLYFRNNQRRSMVRVQLHLIL